MLKRHFLRLFQFCECSFFFSKELPKRHFLQHFVENRPPKKCCFGIFYSSGDDRVNLFEWALICFQVYSYLWITLFGKYRVRNSISSRMHRKKIKLMEQIFFHIMDKHAVDCHNRLRQKLSSLEITWRTSQWPNRAFVFLLVITEINIFCAYKFF